MNQYFISVDLGQQNDYSAISVLELRQDKGFVSHLQRLPLGMAYPAQIEEIKVVYNFVKRIDKNPTLIVDFGGVGRAVSDMLTKEGLFHIKFQITGGDTPRVDGDNWSVPKKELIGSLLVALQTGKLKIIETLPDSMTLIKELENFKMKVTKSANLTFEAREGTNDDLVLSVAMAVYVSGLSKATERYVSSPSPRFNNRGFPPRKRPVIGFERKHRGILGW